MYSKKAASTQKRGALPGWRPKCAGRLFSSSLGLAEGVGAAVLPVAICAAISRTFSAIFSTQTVAEDCGNPSFHVRASPAGR